MALIEASTLSGQFIAFWRLQPRSRRRPLTWQRREPFGWPTSPFKSVSGPGTILGILTPPAGTIITHSLWTGNQRHGLLRPMDIRKQVGRNVRRYRLERDWSQEELAFEAGVHQTYLSGVENGTRNPTITVLKKLADALGVPPAALLE